MAFRNIVTPYIDAFNLLSFLKTDSDKQLAFVDVVSFQCPTPT